MVLAFVQKMPSLGHLNQIMTFCQSPLFDDKLDRQSIRIATRFFSTAIEAELKKNDDNKEAHFVKLVREWYEACDTRGINIYKRVCDLQNFYEFLTELVDWEDLPPPSAHIQGMPVQMYEVTVARHLN